MNGIYETTALLHALFVIAIVAEAMTAALAAGRREMDWVGGVLRDMLCSTIPLLFRAELYATVSIITGLLYVGGLALELNHDLVMAIAMFTGLGLRLLALRNGWRMPKFIYGENVN